MASSGSSVIVRRTPCGCLVTACRMPCGKQWQLTYSVSHALWQAVAAHLQRIACPVASSGSSVTARRMPYSDSITVYRTPCGSLVTACCIHYSSLFTVYRMPCSSSITVYRVPYSSSITVYRTPYGKQWQLRYSTSHALWLPSHSVLHTL
jgi:hypothetical protein